MNRYATVTLEESVAEDIRSEAKRIGITPQELVRILMKKTLPLIRKIPKGSL